MNSTISPHLPLTLDKTNGFLMNDNLKDVAKQNLKMLLLTSPGERVFDSSFGVGLRNYLFELPSPSLDDDVQQAITDQVEKILPYIRIDNIDNFISEEQNGSVLFVKVDYFIIPLAQKDQIEITILL